jgi:hypothetical protein
VGVVGWGGLPGPSFVCPHRCSRSGLPHPFPSSDYGHFGPVDAVFGAFRRRIGGWRGWDRHWVRVLGAGRLSSSFGFVALVNPGDVAVGGRSSTLVTWQPCPVRCGISEQRGDGGRAVLTWVV